jgi:hypothetical protein
MVIRLQMKEAALKTWDGARTLHLQQTNTSAATEHQIWSSSNLISHIAV